MSKVGEEMSSRFKFASDEDVLFIAFGKSDPEQDVANARYGYGICWYTMSDLRRKFTESQQHCYRGLGNLLPWIQEGSPKCQMDVSNVNPDLELGQRSM